MKTLREKQTEIQNTALERWSMNPNSVAEMCTGSGKTRLGVLAVEKVISKFPDAKILIITPREIIRDTVWPEEFKSFGKTSLLKNCTIECIQTVYKWKDTNWDLVIADELHNYLPGSNKDSYEYFKFFENNVYKFFLGLSATIDLSLKPFQLKLGPTCFTYSISQAAKDGVISAFKFVNYAVDLTAEEKDALNKIQRNYTYYEMLLGGPYEAFKSAKIYLGSSTATKDQKQQASVFYGLIKKRKALLDEAVNKLVITHEIMGLFPNSNGIIFSSSINEAINVVQGRTDSVVYHSKLKKKEKAEAIKLLEDPNTKIRCISTVKALNEGVSINNLEYGIQRTGTSTIKDTIQQTGRVCRFIEGKKPLMVRLYIPGTQDEKWMRKSQRDFDQSLIFWCKTMDEFKQILIP